MQIVDYSRKMAVALFCLPLPFGVVHLEFAHAKPRSDEKIPKKVFGRRLQFTYR